MAKNTPIPTSRKLKSQHYDENINKRGHVVTTSHKRDEDKLHVGPWVIAFFIFVIIGSAVFQLISTAM